jgi:hypothetical protein
MAAKQQQDKPKSAPNPKAQAKPKPKGDGLPTGKAREALARRIVKMREQGLKWDGEGGICEQTGIKGAPAGRKLMREFKAGHMIAESYNRDEARERREAKDKAAA